MHLNSIPLAGLALSLSATALSLPDYSLGLVARGPDDYHGVIKCSSDDDCDEFPRASKATCQAHGQNDKYCVPTCSAGYSADPSRGGLVCVPSKDNKCGVKNQDCTKISIGKNATASCALTFPSNTYGCAAKACPEGQVPINGKCVGFLDTACGPDLIKCEHPANAVAYCTLNENHLGANQTGFECDVSCFDGYKLVGKDSESDSQICV